ncbi:hypothetical protein ACJMK2_024135 [Sinanodonta woodiana]|uniref:Uncharacterized protein n=1 Tax=Sinanodonta woodiana TaxID=1069815 RepID=A0ABD3T787_SINWO
MSFDFCSKCREQYRRWLRNNRASLYSTNNSVIFNNDFSDDETSSVSRENDVSVPEKNSSATYMSLMEDSITDTASELEARVTFEVVDQGLERTKRKLMHIQRWV